jgi:hypothetical protein
MTIQVYRKDAIERLELFKKRYRGQETSFVPLDMARRWLEAFAGDEVDMDEIASLMREGEKVKDRYDIAFHAFCNDMREIYNELWVAFLNKEESVD